MKSFILPILAWFSFTICAQPLLTSWHTKDSGRYARIYETLADEEALNAVTTWTHPTAGTGQAEPTYAGVHEISYTATDVYIRTTGLGFHIMGPWYGNEAQTNLFANYPGNMSIIYRIPSTPGPIPTTKTRTGGGAIGYFVDGIAMFDSRDAFSYSNENSADARPTSNFTGDGIWNRDAYVNESVTFDPAFAHQAGENYHYHANPPALRHLLGGSVAYDEENNVYSEQFNGMHSPLLGWVRDGHPVYGPYGYDDPMDPTSGVRRMLSGYIERDGSFGSTNLTLTGRTSLPAWAVVVQGIGPALTSEEEGPAVSATIPLGHYLEDYAYLGDLGLTLGVDFDLDLHNGRFCVTPEFPQGTYAYFVSIEADGTPNFPYNIGRTFYGTPSGAIVNTIPEEATVYFEGGPEAPLIADVDSERGDDEVVLVWSAVEGGRYQVQTSNLTDAWEDLGPEMIADSSEIRLTEDQLLEMTEPRFYRVEFSQVADFDDDGFVYDPVTPPVLTPITVTLVAGGAEPPADLSVEPTIVTLDGTEASFIGRPSQYEVTLDVNLNGALSGTYTVEATFPGMVGTWMGNYIHTAPKNNILLIIVDDWGIDYSPVDNPNGPSLPRMDTLSSLAHSGLRFENAYAQPMCSPTRATILTGRYPFRHGVGDPAGATIPDSELTLPELFAAASSPYSLASYRKWHLGNGRNGPETNGGWTEFKGILGSGVVDYYDWTKTENGTNIDNVQTYSTTEIADDTIAFIQAQPVNTPWFAWVAFNAPHTPFHDPIDTNLLQSDWEVTDTDNNSLYEKSLEAMDSEIGRILSFVDLEKTNVIIIGDNGTPAPVAQEPFGTDRSKSTLYDGGTHVPLIMSGPDVLARGTTEEPVHCADLFSTILQLADIDESVVVPSGTVIDGRSVVGSLSGQDLEDRDIVVELFGTSVTSGRALLKNGYKLIIYDNPEDDTDIPSREFYYLPDDPNEQNNLLLTPVTEEEVTAYNVLVDLNDSLGGNFEDGGYLISTVEVVYIELPNPGTPQVPGLTNTNGTVDPTEILIGGIPATFLGRVDSTETPDVYWVKASIDPVVEGMTSGTYSMTVQFRDHPATGDPRLYTALNTFTVD